MSGEWMLVPVKNAGFAKVDLSDFPLVSSCRWHAVRRKRIIYAETTSPTQIMMHRFIMGATPGRVIDHINGDPLDNRRANLRVCSQAENSRNRQRVRANPSGFKGVSWKADIGKWRSRIMVNRHEISLGAFDSAEDAARAYDTAAAEYFGEFALLNFRDAARPAA